jgi:hypothetical protein
MSRCSREQYWKKNGTRRVRETPDKVKLPSHWKKWKRVIALGFIGNIQNNRDCRAKASEVLLLAEIL